MNSLVQKADSSKQRTLNCDMPLDSVIIWLRNHHVIIYTTCEHNLKQAEGNENKCPCHVSLASQLP